ncbi:hypothetical protein EDEG_01828 [Edhazardia aedis USNM 41457]|uniref:Uncharacterized protein n=1 Tax=Edhazardia aedis (strain USNM 41457) TaxID=1003232 RepID=J9DMS7_EDHAE|nr:hypothetical protein EDEG_01828 [Edhazardia aedis USNM 41457]|eukprot:EJW03875.1 hypothetical protein EDEG_01828 [Edhazardia aedis USNM 41457]
MKYLQIKQISEAQIVLNEICEANDKFHFIIEAYSCKSTKKQNKVYPKKSILSYLVAAMDLAFPDYDFKNFLEFNNNSHDLHFQQTKEEIIDSTKNVNDNIIFTKKMKESNDKVLKIDDATIKCDDFIIGYNLKPHSDNELDNRCKFATEGNKNLRCENVLFNFGKKKNLLKTNLDSKSSSELAIEKLDNESTTIIEESSEFITPDGFINYNVENQLSYESILNHQDSYIKFTHKQDNGSNKQFSSDNVELDYNLEKYFRIVSFKDVKCAILNFLVVMKIPDSSNLTNGILRVINNAIRIHRSQIYEFTLKTGPFENTSTFFCYLFYNKVLRRIVIFSSVKNK